MGSFGDLPDSNSPDLRLVFPTEEEKVQTWTMNHTEWGGALGLEDYLDREPYVASIPLSENGGLRYWILTTAAGTPGSRPVLSSCETLRKKVIVTDPGTGELREDVAYGVGSVYTSPRYRGNRYASRMLQELTRELERGFETMGGKHVVKPIASALWSDIGKFFYAKLGWAACSSFHINFRIPEVGQGSNGVSLPSAQVQPITYENLESFCKRDEELLREQLAKDAKGQVPQFAFLPDHDIMRWALFRDEFIASRLFQGQELTKVKGTVAGPEGRRVWAVWSRNFYNAGDVADKNTMYILRLVLEDETAPRGELAAAFAAVMHQAQAEARLARIGKIELWNPTPAQDALIKASGLDHDVAERQTDSIPSLMWFGEGADAARVRWVANEKYCWS